MAWKWYLANFGWPHILGVVMTAISMAPTSLGFSTWLMGVIVFHAATYMNGSVTK